MSQADQPMLLQLHHGDRGGRLGDGGDLENGVLRDGRDAMSAMPWPWKNARRPLRTTPAAMPTAGSG